ncbi:MAG: hypothetical protein WD066_01175 [Planctomycetaceae bacterium]
MAGWFAVPVALRSTAMSEAKSNCRLCGAISDADRADGPLGIENTPLWTSRHFVVMPCVGPLLVGQVMVVSRRHVPSLAALGPDAIAEYEELAAKLPKNRDTLLEAEHGATQESCAGACITHAHVHWIPGLGDLSVTLDGVLPQFHRGSELRLPAASVPYLFLRGGDRLVRVFDGANLPSQLLRQVICSTLGRDDWDWRADPRRDLILETVEYWSEARVSGT